jgi:hypothetical protein
VVHTFPDTNTCFAARGAFRTTDPNSLINVLLTLINIPIRIGNDTVMPGDIVLGDEQGVLFLSCRPHSMLGQHSDARRVDQEMIGKRQYKSSDLYRTPCDPELRKRTNTSNRRPKQQNRLSTAAGGVATCKHRMVAWSP